ncbi:MAG TPA: hypothetical protein V6C95_08705 [Coleofasciculaceae cyanobacterium]
MAFDFGIQFGGLTKTLYVTKTTAKTNLKIAVECSVPLQTENKQP